MSSSLSFAKGGEKSMSMMVRIYNIRRIPFTNICVHVIVTRVSHRSLTYREKC